MRACDITKQNGHRNGSHHFISSSKGPPAGDPHAGGGDITKNAPNSSSKRKRKHATHAGLTGARCHIIGCSHAARSIRGRSKNALHRAAPKIQISSKLPPQKRGCRLPGSVMPFADSKKPRQVIYAAAVIPRINVTPGPGCA